MPADIPQTHVAQQWAHSSPLICCRFDPTGKYVFASAEDYCIHRWQVADGKKLSYRAGDGSWVGAHALSRDGQRVVTDGYEGRLLCWRAAADKPAPLRTLEAHTGWVRALAVSRDGEWVAS